jgi:proline iminopeptidase
MLTSGFLDVSGGHSIYYEVHGKKGGRPAVILHGGPGGGFSRNMLRIYDLTKWCVLLFDQRGSGRSLPFLSLKHNTTWDLVEDIELLRKQIMGVDKWFVSGGSWGTTLALAYAETYPGIITGLLLRGLCFSDDASFKWLYEAGGASEVYPEEWSKFIKVLPTRLHNADWLSIAKYYHKQLHSTGALQKMKYANAWWKWEAAVSYLLQQKDNATPKETLALATIENHYFVNKAWLSSGQLLRGLKALRKVPITIIHGRYDMVCPISAVHQFKEVLPHTRVIITLAGHAASETDTFRELCCATDKMYNATSLHNATALHNVKKSHTTQYKSKQKHRHKTRKHMKHTK